jgi:signal transduction histidine kinase
VELLREEVRGAEAVSLLGSIQREIDRLTQFTEEYLRLARLPAPALALEPIEGVVRRVARFVQREMEAAEVTLEVRIEPELGVVLHDEAQIRQALLNLLRNAREAMPGGGTIELAARRDGEGVALSVADRGEGIAPDVRARLFDVLFSTKERGTGLGLALTREIVVAHHGEVRCERREGGGTVFTLWLPRAAPGAELEDRAAE